MLSKTRQRLTAQTLTERTEPQGVASTPHPAKKDTVAALRAPFLYHA